MEKKRINWIDVAKFWGMFLIYIGHFGSTSGLIYEWAFTFHVPLFFFLSGCLKNYNTGHKIGHKFNTIIIPYFFFGLLIVVYDALNNSSLYNLLPQIKCLLKGSIRNSCVLSGQLWFLTCLFVIEIFFSIIIKITKSRAGVFLISLVLVVYYVYGIKTKLVWWWNLDSACYFLIFYCIGWITFPYINKLFDTNNKVVRLTGDIIFIFALFFSARLFFGVNLLLRIRTINRITEVIYIIIFPLISIVVMVYFSQWMSKVTFLRNIGKNSLYLCGNENLIKSLFPLALSMFGLNINLTTPIQVYIYTFILLIVTNYVLIPIEKPVLDKIKDCVISWTKIIFSLLRNILSYLKPLSR